MLNSRKIKILIWLILLSFVFFWWKKDFWKSLFQSPVIKGEKVNLIGLGERKVYLISFDPEEEEWLFLSFPSSTYLNTVHNYGKYQVGALLKLGEIEKKGGEILQESIKEYWFFPTEGFLVLANGDLTNKKEVLKNFNIFLRKGHKTNLIKPEVFFLWWQTRRIKEKNFLFLDSENLGILKVLKTDNSGGFEIDEGKFLKLAGQYLKDPRIVKENLAIAVLNGTSHQGLAEGRAKIIEMLGGRIVEITNSATQVEENCLLLSSREDKKRYTVKKFLRTFDCQWQEKQANEIRKDIILIIGEKYWKKLTER